jgi:gamma-glutamylaminecyclotransferase
MASILLFVYGTLKSGGRNHDLLAGQQFQGTAVTRPRYRLYDQGAYPCLVEDREIGVAVRGELWRVEESLLDRLDAFEGAPGLFVRRPIELCGPESTADAYLYQGGVTGFADCGDFWPG